MSYADEESKLERHERERVVALHYRTDKQAMSRCSWAAANASRPLSPAESAEYRAWLRAMGSGSAVDLKEARRLYREALGTEVRP